MKLATCFLFALCLFAAGQKPQTWATLDAARGGIGATKVLTAKYIDGRSIYFQMRDGSLWQWPMNGLSLESQEQAYRTVPYLPADWRDSTAETAKEVQAIWRKVHQDNRDGLRNFNVEMMRAKILGAGIDPEKIKALPAVLAEMPGADMDRVRERAVWDNRGKADNAAKLAEAEKRRQAARQRLEMDRARDRAAVQRSLQELEQKRRAGGGPDSAFRRFR